MTDKEQLLKEHLEDLMLERDTLLDVIRRFKQELHDMTVERDKWRHDHKLLAIEHKFTKQRYDDYLKENGLV